MAQAGWQSHTCYGLIVFSLGCTESGISLGSPILVQPPIKKKKSQVRWDFISVNLLFFWISASQHGVDKDPCGGKFSCKLAYSLFSAIPIPAGKGGASWMSVVILYYENFWISWWLFTGCFKIFRWNNFLVQAVHTRNKNGFVFTGRQLGWQKQLRLYVEI